MLRKTLKYFYALEVEQFVIISSLLWLFFGNLSGLILSILIEFPNLNNLIAPATYGRWAPVHLNFQLYGWSTIPIIGLLFKIYFPSKSTDALPKLAILVWSSSLIIGALSWLMGNSSGKIFLEWTGASKYIFISNLFFLWFVLSNKFIQTKMQYSRITSKLKGTLLLFLLTVPFVLLVALDPKTFPPINVYSSGATGASLLISTLAIVLIFIFSPLIISDEHPSPKIIKIISICLFFHILGWSRLNHGHSSHFDLSQILGLASLIIWIPLLTWYYHNFSWHSSLLPWLKSFLTWSTILVISATLMFLPGNLEIAKFSSILVAHVHLAMAGMLTSFLFLLLSNYKDEKWAALLSARLPYILWNTGLVLHLIALIRLGGIESDHPGFGFLTSSYDNLLVLRIIGGLLMLVASIDWLLKSIKLALRECLNGC